MIVRTQMLALTALISVAPAAAETPAVDLAAARASLPGEWEGKLEYLDYGAGEWFGLPVRTRIVDQGDGVTQIRTSDFDDGPQTGIVRITTVDMLDAKSNEVSVASFRKGRTVEVYRYAIRLQPGTMDATRWTIVEETMGEDDERPALIRLTTKRDGSALETLKEVDFQDDDKAEWITRNRTRLTQVKDPG